MTEKSATTAKKATVAKKVAPVKKAVKAPATKRAATKKVVAAKKHEIPMVEDLQRHFELTLGRDNVSESHHYLYSALAYTIRDKLVSKWRQTNERYDAQQPKRVNYLSLEFLMGRSLNNAILNLDLDTDVREALNQYHCKLEEVESEEVDAGLGNGGLGRLAACFLDSCATLEIPVTGYGIRYQYGMFHQEIKDGYQIELPDPWLRNGNPWEIERPENTRRVKFFGHTQYYQDDNDDQRVRWANSHDVLAVPFDMPIPGYRNETVNTLRLWKADATDEFDLQEFNDGCYTDAVAEKTRAEQITMVLYPNDVSEQGKELRLRQQYFLASASLQDIVAQWVKANGEDFTHFHEKNCFQLNDTHPTVAIPELMRLLMDEHNLGWDQAWSITTKTMAYTNHTLLPEALEAWSVQLFKTLLPRILDIIYEINARFLSEVSVLWPGDTGRMRRMSIIEEGDYPRVRMAYLAIVGSYSVNGVAALHTDLLQKGLFKDFYEMWQGKFNNKTNGVTTRRWLAHCNPLLSELITKKIGDQWIKDHDKLALLKTHANKAPFKKSFLAIKTQNKQALADLVKEKTGVEFKVDMMFDVQVKRIHEYKRQLLNVLHVVHLYNRIVRGDTQGMQPRCVLIGGKAAPGYFMAKSIIKLINNIAQVVNADEKANDWLKVAFIPDYCVTAMEIICPGTDLSEQISTAGKEASGTGNMKFMMNGAITIGTLDGANIEIREAVGAENFFLFGLTAQQVAENRAGYNPSQIIADSEAFSQVMSLLESGHFNLFERGIFDHLVATIRDVNDPWMTAADFDSYIAAQEKVGALYKDRSAWAQMAILNTASSGGFSSDRTIGEYLTDIWQRKV